MMVCFTQQFYQSIQRKNTLQGRKCLYFLAIKRTCCKKRRIILTTNYLKILLTKDGKLTLTHSTFSKIFSYSSIQQAEAQPLFSSLKVH